MAGSSLGSSSRATLGLSSRGFLAVAAFLLSACGGGASPPPAPAALPPGEVPAGAPADPSASPSLTELSVGHTVVADSIPLDPALEGLVAAFRERIATEIEEVVGEASMDLTERQPEGTLGNFAADALLWAAGTRLHDPAQLALMNNGGLRVPLSRGPVTVRHMFELMPFDNYVSVLVLTGAQLQELAGTLARRGGEPIAGFTFRIGRAEGEPVARDIRVGGESVDLDAHYRLVTNDYLANGGDEMSVLLSALERTDYPLLVRDAFIEYTREARVLEERIEGRITVEGGR